MRTDRLAILALFLPAALFAQAPGPGTITGATELRLAPDGRVLAQLKAGAGAQILATKNGWTQVAVDGWLHVSVLGPKRDSFPVSVKSPNGANLSWRLWPRPLLRPTVSLKETVSATESAVPTVLVYTIRSTPASAAAPSTFLVPPTLMS